MIIPASALRHRATGLSTLPVLLTPTPLSGPDFSRRVRRLRSIRAGELPSSGEG